MFHQSTSSSSALSRERVLTLADYGWDTERGHSFAPSRAQGLVPGRVVRAERGLCGVVVETGLVHAVVLPPSGTDDRLTPCTGDWVAVQSASPAASATVVEVLERRTAVVRSTSSRTSQAQVLAANVDTVAVAVSLADPLKLGRIERMLGPGMGERRHTRGGAHQGRPKHRPHLGCRGGGRWQVHSR